MSSAITERLMVARRTARGVQHRNRAYVYMPDTSRSLLQVRIRHARSVHKCPEAVTRSWFGTAAYAQVARLAGRSTVA